MKTKAKSCSCLNCRKAKGSKSANAARRRATRADRRRAKAELRIDGEDHVSAVVSASRAS